MWHATCKDPWRALPSRPAPNGPKVERPMETAIYIALSRQDALRRQLAVTANNLANMNTTAYKAEQMLFVEYLNAPDGVDPTSPDAVSMVTDQAVVRDTTEGPVEHTGNPLDVAIDGPGFLVVDTAGGPRYTRNGRLQIDAEGKLVDVNGLAVLDDTDRPLIIPANAGQIAIDGEGNLTSDAGPIGRIRIVEFDDDFGLTPLGAGLYATNELPQDADDSNLVQGALEGSNVQPIVEMTQMIEISRSYQSIQNFIKSEHERQKQAISQLGTVKA